MYRDIISVSSALALVVSLAGMPALGDAHEGERLCRVILDGDGEPVRESDTDEIAHSNSGDCPDDVVEDSGADQEQTADATGEIIDPLTVYFDVNRDNLDAGANAEVSAYAAQLMATSPTSLSVVGYTDTAGPADLNARLSNARADNVAAALVEAGVPAGMITRGASGEDGLAVDTPDGTREASNRRVTITPTY